jgi:hypothetical protein
MAAFTVALISAVAALYRLAFAWCFAWLLRRNLALACVAVPFLWVASEFGLYSMPAIGFPWNLLGYAAAHSLVLLQLAPLPVFAPGGLFPLLSPAGSQPRLSSSRHLVAVGYRKQYRTTPPGSYRRISRSRTASRPIGFSSTRAR